MNAPVPAAIGQDLKVARSADARKVLRGLNKELVSASTRAGRELEFSAAELAILDLISAALDRISDLRVAYAEVDEVKVRVKLSTELRLLEQAVARMIRQIRTDLPPTESGTTVKARRAADARWARDRASG